MRKFNCFVRGGLGLVFQKKIRQMLESKINPQIAITGKMANDIESLRYFFNVLGLAKIII
jgi:hypothetical protein